MSDRPTIDQVQEEMDKIPEVIRAPFTPEQCQSLNAYQVHRPMHPFTCPNDHIYPDYVDCTDCDKDTPGQIITGTIKHGEHTDDEYTTCSTCEGTGKVVEPNLSPTEIRVQHICLVALEDGWHCAGESCDYTQDWAWPWMASGEWKLLSNTLNSLGLGDKV